MDEYTLGGLFVSAFLSSTLLPGSSEILLAVLTAKGAYDRWVLWGVATAGNTLGGMTSWGLGYLLGWRWPWAKLSTDRSRRSAEWIRRWGSPILLLSWVPVIGDPLCVAAGWLRVNALVAMAFIGAGKALRYAAVVSIFS